MVIVTTSEVVTAVADQSPPSSGDDHHLVLTVIGTRQHRTRTGSIFHQISRSRKCTSSNKEFCRQNGAIPASDWVYRKVFNSEFNLAFSRYVRNYTLHCTERMSYTPHTCMPCILTHLESSLIYSFSPSFSPPSDQRLTPARHVTASRCA